ncbi:MAG: cobyric acid synthase [Devosiaceae bacterium]|nr:cobyric acid synthase [Devosiaceae bacterium]
MSAKALMLMGTGSDVGKSLIVAGLCRAYKLRGLKVLPFKPQNMSNNAAVTIDGGEIGRAQALQALAAGVEPVSAMNPILLKPEHEAGAQVIIRGKRVGSMSAKEYFSKRQKYLSAAVQAFEELSQNADLVLVEGAGSASEINLRKNDIANFGFARALNIPVVVIGDIARGGVIASLYGTFKVIDPKDAKLIVASLINRFQGDPLLFEEGKNQIASLTNCPCLGPVPHFADASLLPAEDILGLTGTQDVGEEEIGTEEKSGTKQIKIAIPLLPRIANFDDFDPLKAHSGVDLQFIAPGNTIPVDADLIILPGSKTTRADLEFLINQGWDIDIKSHHRRGKKIFGICAGFQMLGKTISDPHGIEGDKGSSKGLGLLNITTELDAHKQLRVEQAIDAQFNLPLFGYHMHMGKTDGPDCARGFADVHGVAEGAKSLDGLVSGTYLHGVFASDEYRNKFLSHVISDELKSFNYHQQIDQVLNDFASHLEQHLDLDALLDMARSPVFANADSEGRAKN